MLEHDDKGEWNYRERKTSASQLEAWQSVHCVIRWMEVADDVAEATGLPVFTCEMAIKTMCVCVCVCVLVTDRCHGQTSRYQMQRKAVQVVRWRSLAHRTVSTMLCTSSMLSKPSTQRTDDRLTDSSGLTSMSNYSLTYTLLWCKLSISIFPHTDRHTHSSTCQLLLLCLLVELLYPFQTLSSVLWFSLPVYN